MRISDWSSDVCSSDLNDPEEEHDCFSDNTHNSHYYNQLGIRNVYLGSYTRVDGKTVAGASLSDLVKARDPKLDAEMRSKLDATVAAMQAMRERADTEIGSASRRDREWPYV